MPSPRINRRQLSVALAAAALPSSSALAQVPAFPFKPIRLVAPFAPGGAADTVARILLPKFSGALGQAVIVDNRAGASGAIGSAFVANAPADGYTLLINLGPPHQTVQFFSKVPYDPVKDFTPIALAASAPQVLVVSASSPFKSAKEFIAAARAESKGLTYGTSGIGTSQHLAGLLLASSQKAKLTHVGYRGGSAALTDVLAGQTDAALIVLSNALPHISAGRVRALAVLESHRARSAPEIPTLAEGGVTGFSIPDTWVGVVGPRNLPAAIVSRLHADISGVLRDPDVSARLEKAGYEPRAAAPDAFARLLSDSEQVYRRVVQAAGIVPE